MPSIRRARPADLKPLVALENRVFSYDRLSARSFRHAISSPHAVLLVAVVEAVQVGYVLVLFRRVSRLARLYSIAVGPLAAGQGIGTRLLAAAEAAARKRRSSAMRLEVKATNRKAIRRYTQAGYRVIGERPDYYDDGGDALRFEKLLYPPKASG